MEETRNMHLFARDDHDRQEDTQQEKMLMIATKSEKTYEN
jgi:hypothetical protein